MKRDLKSGREEFLLRFIQINFKVELIQYENFIDKILVFILNIQVNGF